MIIRKATVRRAGACVSLVFAAMCNAGCGSDAAGPAAGVTESRFTRGMEGWSIIGSGMLSHVATGGNPGGYLQATDLLSGPPMYFAAAPEHLGDRSAAHGRFLSFDLRWHSGVGSGEVPDDVQVILWGGGLTLYASLEDGPDADWRRFSVRLDTAGGWLHGADDRLATDAEIQQLLGALEQIWIRAEYNAGMETTDLDNVIFGAQG